MLLIFLLGAYKLLLDTDANFSICWQALAAHLNAASLMFVKAKIFPFHAITAETHMFAQSTIANAWHQG